VRRFSWILLLPVILAAILFAIANRADVLVSFNPLNPVEGGVQLPLYAVVLIAMFIGILLGGATVWMKQRKWRLMARASNTETQIVSTARSHSRAA